MITDTYLLATEYGQQRVVQYSPADMEEIFTLGERLDLDACKPVVKSHRHAQIRYVNMIAAARQIAA